MRVLRLVHTVDAATGGPIAGIRALSPVLAAAGHVTDVLSCTPPPLGQEHIDGIRRVYHVASSPGAPPESGLVDPGSWLAAHARDYDVAVSHGLWQPQTRLARRYLRGRIPYFVFPHGMLDPWFKRAWPAKHLKKQLYWLLAEHAALRNAAAVLYTCEEERRLARGTFWPYRCTERVVCYGAATPPAPSAEQRSAFAGRVPALGERPYWLFLGRVHEKKGVDILLQAYADLALQCTSAEAGTAPLPALVIAGPEHSPDYSARLRTLAAALPAHAAVHWAGMLDGPAKWGALAGAEAFVLPSHQENFGIAVVEALACGTPVLISSQINIWRELVGDGAGLVAPDTRAGTLDLLSRWLATPPAARESARTQARTTFQRRYAMDAVASSFLSTMKEFVA